MKYALDELRKQGFNINSNTGAIALQNAISNGYFDAVKLLMENGMRISQKDIKNAKEMRRYGRSVARQHDIAGYLEKFL